MAIIHGGWKAGQYAKRRASRYFIRMMWWSLGGACICGVVLGFIIATELGRLGLFRWAAESQWWFVAVAAGLAGGSLWGLRRLDVYTEKLAIRRVGWLRGGQGEALVAWYLNDLPDTWHVFHNVERPAGGDWDHVLVGPVGIFCVSTKSHRGLYTVQHDGTYLLNGKETNHIRESISLAMNLRDEVERVAGRMPWIQAVLIAPFAYLDFNTFQNNVWVLHEGNLNEVFLDAEERLKPADVERIARVVQQVKQIAG